jgi:hypothetical protein
VTTLADFKRMEDNDFELSGIPIKQRRQQKLELDRQAATRQHNAAQLEQVQGVIDTMKLSTEGRALLRKVATLEELRGLGKEALAEMGVLMMDRRIFDETIQKQHVQSMQAPEMEVVMTAPEWDAWHADKYDQRVYCCCNGFCLLCEDPWCWACMQITGLGALSFSLMSCGAYTCGLQGNCCVTLSNFLLGTAIFGAGAAIPSLAVKAVCEGEEVCDMPASTVEFVDSPACHHG